jgi:hypothetical protein
MADMGSDATQVVEGNYRHELTRSDRMRTGVQMALEELVAGAENAVRVHRRNARLWSRMHFVVGLPAVVLAACAGATALVSSAGRVTAGCIALVSAGVGSAVAFLDTDTQEKSNRGLAAGWQDLLNQARLHLRVDLHDASWIRHHAREELARLHDQERQLLEGRVPDGSNARSDPANSFRQLGGHV